MANTTLLSGLAQGLVKADSVEALASNRPLRVSAGRQAGLVAVQASRASLFEAGVVFADLRLFREHNYSLAPADVAFQAKKRREFTREGTAITAVMSLSIRRVS